GLAAFGPAEIRIVAPSAAWTTIGRRVHPWARSQDRFPDAALQAALGHRLDQDFVDAGIAGGFDRFALRMACGHDHGRLADMFVFHVPKRADEGDAVHRL